MAYVYLHKKPNGQIFYVGKGSKKRAYSKYGRNEYWKRVVKKYGYEVVIFLDNLTHEKAYSIEKDLIEAIGLDNLVNLTEGGVGGVSGLKHSNETKDKISKANKGRRSFRKGKKLPKEHRVRIGLGNKGKKMSIEAKRKISENSGNKIGVVDTITGIKYDSIDDYCRKNNLNFSMFKHHFYGRRKVNKFKHIKRL